MPLLAILVVALITGCGEGSGVTPEESGGEPGVDPISDTGPTFPSADSEGGSGPSDAPGTPGVEIKDPGPREGDDGAEPTGPPDTQGIEEGDVPPELACAPPASTGCECDGNDDCASGWCVPTAEGFRCTKECDASCPEGFACKGINSGGDPSFVCVPLYTNLCRPCTSGSDCETLGDVGGYCIDYEDGSGSFCGGICSDDLPCPEGYECQTIKVNASTVAKQCVRVDGECPCNNNAIKEEASTLCWQSNLFGTCEAERLCTEQGVMTECTAKVPNEELCNGEDDDCDGQVDEEIAEPCIAENIHGTCFGEGVCVDGAFQECDAPEPEEDICNGEDDNCDGLVDEGFPDTDLDGLADCIDPDIDGDLIDNEDDICPEHADPTQSDQDEDGLGDACDPDLDGDGTDNLDDCAPADPEFQCSPYFWDGDQDGAPICDAQKCLCGPTSKYTATGCNELTQDCDDQNPNVNPAASDLCNGKDDDCDGKIDEDFADKGLPCDGDDGDLCTNGAWVCTPQGGVACDEAPGPGIQEICNGVDDNCNGAVDELWPELNTPCDSDDDDLCENGVLLCAPDGQSTACSAEIPSNIPEACNGEDDDCDGLLDEDWPELGEGCDGEDEDLCANGVLICSEDGVGPVCGVETDVDTSELCNGLDEDCDGLTDEDFEDLGASCDGDDIDLCDDGIVVCAFDEQSTVCADSENPLEEICDGVDNDCNGETDEFWPELGEICDGQDSDLCAHGSIVCNSLDPLTTICGPEEPANLVELCDTPDDDNCDGLENEGCDVSPDAVGVTVTSGAMRLVSETGGHGVDLFLGETGVIGRLGPPAEAGGPTVDLGLVPAMQAGGSAGGGP